jgi:hypothetical protein
MLIPVMLYGLYPEVQKQVRKAVTRIIKGESLEAVLTADGMLDTVTTPGFIYFAPVAKGFEESPNFHTFLVCWILRDAYIKKKLSDSIEQGIYQELLETDWGILLLSGRDSAQDWLKKPGRFVSFTRASIQIQNEFTAIGNRFEMGSNNGKSFWVLPHGLMYSMANLGFPDDEVDKYFERQKIPLTILESPLLKPDLETIP